MTIHSSIASYDELCFYTMAGYSLTHLGNKTEVLGSEPDELFWTFIDSIGMLQRANTEGTEFN